MYCKLESHPAHKLDAGRTRPVMVVDNEMVIRPAEALTT
jgi:hypothetical protein